jgi:Transposase DDE domain
VPAVPSCILDPLREQFLSLLPVRHVVHPLGCHRPRIADAVVFDKLVEVLVFGAGYERIADAGCSATTMRRRRDEWIALGVWDRMRLACLDAYDQIIGLDLADLAVDGCTTKAVCGGECAGRSPVDRAKGGMKRSQLSDGAGIPLATVPAPANTVDHQLLPATLDALKDFQPLPCRPTVHLDAGYDYRPCLEALDERGLLGQIAHRGTPRRSRSAAAGWSSEPTPGSTTSASSAAAPSDAATASMPTLPWPPRSSLSVRSSGPPGTATAGTPGQDHHGSADLLADALSHRHCHYGTPRAR